MAQSAKSLACYGHAHVYWRQNNHEGTMEEFYFKSGEFRDVNSSLNEIIKLSKLLPRQLEDKHEPREGYKIKKQVEDGGEK